MGTRRSSTAVCKVTDEKEMSKTREGSAPFASFKAAQCAGGSEASHESQGSKNQDLAWE